MFDVIPVKITKKNRKKQNFRQVYQQKTSDIVPVFTPFDAADLHFRYLEGPGQNRS